MKERQKVDADQNMIKKILPKDFVTSLSLCSETRKSGHKFDSGNLILNLIALSKPITHADNSIRYHSELFSIHWVQLIAQCFVDIVTRWGDVRDVVMDNM